MDANILETSINPLSAIFFLIVPFFLTAVCYFFSKIRACLFFLIIFYISNFIVTDTIFYDNHVYLFYFVITFSCILPVIFLIIFALDVKYALFCIDTSFLVPLIWVMVPPIVVLNVIMLIIMVVGVK